MPNMMSTMSDRVERACSARAERREDNTLPLALPSSAWASIVRGFWGRCPRCAGGKLFARFLKPVAACGNCGQDWTPHRADDFPAYLSILITGHLLAPIVIVLAGNAEMSSAMLSGLIFTLAAVLTVGLLQPAKGAVIALQWWFGMHGFKRDRIDDLR